MARDGVKAKRAQLELAPLAHLALVLRKRRHPRVELLARDDARRAIQLRLDPRERSRRAAAAAAPSVPAASALVRRYQFRVARRAVPPHLVDALEESCAAGKVDQWALVDDGRYAAAVVVVL
jgi:hypothetical protein